MDNRENQKLGSLADLEGTSFYSIPAFLDQDFRELENGMMKIPELSPKDNLSPYFLQPFDEEFCQEEPNQLLNQSPEESQRQLEDNIVDAAIKLRRSKSSGAAFQHQQDSELENERRLISETRQLIISDSSEDSSPQTFSSSMCPTQNHKIFGVSRPRSLKNHQIKRVKQLVRELRKIQKKGTQYLKGSFKLKGEHHEIVVKEGRMNAIFSQKGAIGGLMIKKQQQELIMKLRNGQSRNEQIRVESWIREQKKWAQFVLEADIKTT